MLRRPAINCVVLVLAECKKLSDELVALRKELNETKSQVVIAEYKRESDIQYQHRKAQQEIASLQQLVHGLCVHSVPLPTFIYNFSRHFNSQKPSKSRVHRKQNSIVCRSKIIDFATKLPIQNNCRRRPLR